MARLRLLVCRVLDGERLDRRLCNECGVTVNYSVRKLSIEEKIRWMEREGADEETIARLMRDESKVYYREAVGKREAKVREQKRQKDLFNP